MPLQDWALKTVAPLQAGEHPLETCGLHLLWGGGAEAEAEAEALLKILLWILVIKTGPLLTILLWSVCAICVGRVPRV